MDNNNTEVETQIESAEKSVLLEAEQNDEKITDIDRIERALEALIFASPKALSLARIKQILSHNSYGCDGLKDILSSLQARYEQRGLQLVKVAGGYQFRSHLEFSPVLAKLLEDKPARLSSSALEVLAIIAYKQPVTRAEIDAVRGIDSGHLLRGLMEKNIVRTMGHAETPGRPLLYGTTSYFLEVFSLDSLDDLPSIEEFERELQELGGQEDDESANGDTVLAADPDYYDKASPLAAEPNRGAFDEPTEEEFSEADFGIQQHVQEELENEEAASKASDVIEAENIQ